MDNETKQAHANMLKKLDEFTKSFDSVREEIHDFKREVREHSKERDDKIDTMFSLYTSGKASVKIMKIGFYGMMALGGAYIMLKQIFGIVIK